MCGKNGVKFYFLFLANKVNTKVIKLQNRYRFLLANYIPVKLYL